MMRHALLERPAAGVLRGFTRTATTSRSNSRAAADDVEVAERDGVEGPRVDGQCAHALRRRVGPDDTRESGLPEARLARPRPSSPDALGRRRPPEVLGDHTRPRRRASQPRRLAEQLQARVHEVTALAYGGSRSTAAKGASGPPRARRAPGMPPHPAAHDCAARRQGACARGSRVDGRAARAGPAPRDGARARPGSSASMPAGATAGEEVEERPSQRSWPLGLERPEQRLLHAIASGRVPGPWRPPSRSPPALPVMTRPASGTHRFLVREHLARRRRAASQPVVSSRPKALVGRAAAGRRHRAASRRASRQRSDELAGPPVAAATRRAAAAGRSGPGRGPPLRGAARVHLGEREAIVRRH